METTFSDSKAFVYNPYALLPKSPITDPLESMLPTQGNTVHLETVVTRYMERDPRGDLPLKEKQVAKKNTYCDHIFLKNANVCLLRKKLNLYRKMNNDYL